MKLETEIVLHFVIFAVYVATIVGIHAHTERAAIEEARQSRVISTYGK